MKLETGFSPMLGNLCVEAIEICNDSGFANFAAKNGVVVDKNASNKKEANKEAFVSMMQNFGASKFASRKQLDSSPKYAKIFKEMISEPFNAG
jgi:hypothetical protein